MKTKKLFLSVFLSMFFMFSCFVSSIPVYASNGGTGSSWDSFNGKISDFMQDLTGTVLAPFEGVSNAWKQYFNNNKSNYTDDNSITPEDFVNQNYYYNNETGNNEVSVNLSNCLIDFTKNYIDSETGFGYVYSYYGQQFVNRFDTNTHYSKFIDILSAYNSEEYFIAYNPRVDAGHIFIFDALVYDTGEYGLARPDCFPYYDWSIQTPQKYFSYNSQTGEYTIDSEFSNAHVFTPSTFHVDSSEMPNINYNYFYGVTLQSRMFQVFKSEQAMRDKTLGVQDYYVTDSFNNFNHVDNSQNINQTTLDNSISYSDVSSYINSYYISNNTYPTTTQINYYINNYNGSGGGSGGDDDDNNNNDDDEDGNGFFKLLKKVFDFVSKLLDTVAGFLADLVDSLGEVVNSVLDNILSLFTNLKDGIPNVISELLVWFFPFLPEEIISLIELSITLIVIYGLIKLIRGS